MAKLVENAREFFLQHTPTPNPDDNRTRAYDLDCHTRQQTRVVLQGSA